MGLVYVRTTWMVEIDGEYIGINKPYMDLVGSITYIKNIWN